MIKNVFITSTSIQYYNAREAVASLGLEYSESLLLIPAARLEHAGMPSEDWADVKVWSYNKVMRATKLLGRNPVGRLARVHDNISQFKSLMPERTKDVDVYVGNILDKRMRHLVNWMGPRSVTLLDDGTATLVVIDKLLQRENNSLRKERKVDSLFGVRSAYPKAGRFFTAYDTPVPEGWSATLNEYPLLQARAAEAGRRDEVLVVGGPYVDFGWLGLDSYVEAIASLTRDATYPLTYVPHPRESEEVIGAIQERVGAGVWRPKGALEVAVIDENRIPREVLGFTSSVLINMARMYDGMVCVRAAKVTFPYASLQNKGNMDMIYKYIRNDKNISIIDRTGF